MQVGSYTLGRPLGRGATATVYEAKHLETAASAAIKLYSSTRSLKPAARKRVQQELSTLSRLEHPGIVRLTEAGEHDGMLYVVMELVRGETLEARITREGPLPQEEAREITQALSAAVDYVHRCGVLHRDIKPANVLLSPRGPLLTDFGLARDTEDVGERLTRTGVLMGTPGFLAPEQASGVRARIGKPADVYGLGALLYACLTGVPPVQGESMAEVIAATVQGKLTSPRVLRPDLDPALERLCMSALALEPERRPSAEALARGLGTPGAVAAPRRARLPALLGVGLLVALLGALGLGLALRPRGPSPEELASYRTRFEEGDPEQRERCARELIAAYPEAGLGYVLLARHLAFGVGDEEQARRTVEQAQRLAPEDDEVWAIAARVYAMSGDPQGALEACERAVELNPREHIGTLAGRLYAAKEYERAEACFHRWLEFEPRSGLAYAQLARMQRDRERWAEALSAYDRAVELSPEAELGALYKDRSEVREQVGDVEGALADVDAAAALHGDYYLGLRARQAHLLAVAKRYPEAAVAYRQALEIYPTQAAWVYTLYRIERRLGNEAEADRLLERAFELSKQKGVHPELRDEIQEEWIQRER